MVSADGSGKQAPWRNQPGTGPDQIAKYDILDEISLVRDRSAGEDLVWIMAYWCGADWMRCCEDFP